MLPAREHSIQRYRMRTLDADVPDVESIATAKPLPGVVRSAPNRTTGVDKERLDRGIGTSDSNIDGDHDGAVARSPR